MVTLLYIYPPLTRMQPQTLNHSVFTVYCTDSDPSFQYWKCFEHFQKTYNTILVEQIDRNWHHHHHIVHRFRRFWHHRCTVRHAGKVGVRGCWEKNYICWSVFTKSNRFSARFWHFWKFMSCICQCNISVIRRPYIYIDDGIFGCEEKSATDILVMVLFLSKHGTMAKIRETCNVYTFLFSSTESFIEAIRACNHKILFNVFLLLFLA